MHEVAAYSTVAMTLGLVVARPRVGTSLRLSPAMAAVFGVLAMVALGIVEPHHLLRAATSLWRPFVAIAAIMVMTDVAMRVGLLDLWAARVEHHARSTAHLFFLVFGLGVITSATLNNDAAILLLTPLVVAMVRRLYPHRPRLIVPFAFAVFMSAGVAALPVSNPMNMVVSEFSGIGFNEYTLRMAPVAAAGWIIAFLLVRGWFAVELREPLEPQNERPLVAASRAQALMMALLAAVLLSYGIIGYFGGPVWIVATGGAALALFLAARATPVTPIQILGAGVCWGTLLFLLAVLVLSMGLFEVGLVDRLEALYQNAGLGTIGVASALGSAVLNNHPMSHLNMMALEGAAAGKLGVLAALVGGDLGPRLLPMGSLAGLLWLEMLRRNGVEIGIGRFVTIGVVVTIPTMAASLAILSLFA